MDLWRVPTDRLKLRGEAWDRNLTCTEYESPRGRWPVTSDTFARHNDMVAELNAAYAEGRNDRVPITVAWDESLWLHLAGRGFREYYTDPRIQLDVTLEGMAWCAENVVHDARMGPPAEAWTLAPRWWMDEPECLGCDVVIQEHDFAWSQPLDVPKAELIAHVRAIDPLEAVRGSRLFRLYRQMSDAADGMLFKDVPVKIAFPGGTHGVFTVAARVRGEERLCLDLAEDPDFAYQFIGAVTDHTIGRVKAWHRLAETGQEFPNPNGWGMPDDSLQMISPETYRRFVLPHHERIFSTFTTGRRSMHLCGHAQQHYETLHHELGITALDGPGPLADLGSCLTRMPELSISAQTDHTLLITGPNTDIDRMMQTMLTPETRQPGRYRITGFIIPDTPLANVGTMYEAGKAYGRIALSA